MFRISKFNSLRDKPKPIAIVEKPLGYVPDVVDNRDYIYNPTLSISPTPIFLISKLPPILDQGKLGSCVSNAVANSLRYIYSRLKKNNNNWSRLFNYYYTRVIENTVNIDNGCQIRNAFKVCNKTGSCYETVWPYTISKFKIQPSITAVNAAKKNIITKYNRVDQTRSAIQACLFSSNTVVVGFSCFTSLFSTYTTTTGNITYPIARERYLGGHCVLLVGYDDTTEKYTFMNSWGTKWGKKGFGTIPYSYLENPSLAGDFWTLTL